MKNILLISILFFGTVALAQEIDREAIADAEVSRFLADWTKNMKAEKRLNRYKHKASVVHWSLYWNVDPLLVSRLMAEESSWRPDVRGALGEWGLMQLINAKILAKYPDLKTDPDTNVKAGCDLLRQCMDACPNLKSAVGKYGSGYCTETGSWLAGRWKKYQRDVAKYRHADCTQ